MTSFHRDIANLAVTLAIPAAAFLSVPAAAYRFSATEFKPHPRSFEAALVTLTETDEARALAMAKSAWRGESSRMRLDTADLIYATLPQDAPHPVARLSERMKPLDPENVAAPVTPYLPSVAAPSPQSISAEKELPPSSPFSREDLLKAPFR